MIEPGIHSIWSYFKDGRHTYYRVEGLPTVRNILHEIRGEEPKWVPGVRYKNIKPKDPEGTGDNQEFVRTKDDFIRNFEYEAIEWCTKCNGAIHPSFTKCLDCYECPTLWSIIKSTTKRWTRTHK